MTQVNGIESVFPQQTTAKTKGSGEKLGQQDFMQLLVAQLKNQDPGKPMDNFQFLSQIAQFGMVDGIQSLDKSFGQVSDSFRQNQVLQAGSLLGRQVRSETESTTIGEGGTISGAINVPDIANNVSLEVRAASGEVVRKVSAGLLPAGETPFVFDGLDETGRPVPAGEYSIHASGEIAGEVQDLKLSTMSTVTSVTVDSAGSVALHLANGNDVGLADINEFK